MAVLTSSQQTFVDITDQRKLSAYITSNLPKSQVYDPDTDSYAPNWQTDKLTLTPVVFLDQTGVTLGSTGLTISWKRKDGSGTETSVSSSNNETVSTTGILTVAKNTLSSANSGMLTYICYISYYDAETKNTVNISSDITYTLVRNASNAHLVSVDSDTYVFKYDKNANLVGTAQATLTAQAQGVSISAWKYKNSSGAWVNYPTTSDNTTITGSTLIVKPTHSVFVSDVAQIRVTTNDADVYDTVSISKLYDGSAGSTGQGGLSIVLGNEAQTIACTSDGKVATALEITIPFTGYIGTAQTACTCSVGTLPSGVTIKSNTAATASASGSVVLSVSADSTLGNASTMNGTIDLTFTISGTTVVKKFSWSKSTKGGSGAAGENAITFSVYAPNGTVIQNQSGSLTLATSAYDGSTAISSGAAYQWAKYVSGQWTNISNATAATYTVQGSDVINVQSYRCTMTYKSKSYVDVITIEDKSDPYVSEMLSIGGFTVKNGIGGVVPYIIVRTNQKEVDTLKGSISESAPSSPSAGMYWYKIDHANKAVTLMKYSGSAWQSSSDTQELIYTWYKQDKNGKESAFDKTGKVIYLSADDIDSIATLQCDVSK